MTKSLLNLPGQSVEKKLRLSFSLRLRRQMNLNLAAIEENRRLRVLILRIDWRDSFVNSRLAHSCDTKDATHDAHIACFQCELRLHKRFKHRLHLARRAGQQRHAPP